MATLTGNFHRTKVQVGGISMSRRANHMTRRHIPRYATQEAYVTVTFLSMFRCGWSVKVSGFLATSCPAGLTPCTQSDSGLEMSEQEHSMQRYIPSFTHVVLLRKTRHPQTYRLRPSLFRRNPRKGKASEANPKSSGFPHCSLR
jgi:hypothetical protein